MSGLEVVIGLVLGAIPIAISACEHWRGVAEKYGRISSFEKQYRKIIEDLKDEQVIFRLQVERLLAPLVTGEIVQEGDLERLVENTQDPLWADEDITCAIMKRLGKAYENYVRVLADIESDCMRLLKSLGFDKPEVQDRIFGKRSASDQASLTTTQKLMDNTRSAFVNFNLQFEAERFAFGFNKLKHEDVIKDIHDHNEKLGTFLELTGEIATLHERSSQGVSRTAPKYLLQYWRHAERLYNMIKHAWGCQCRDVHCARLWLQHRTSPSFEFHLLMLFSLIGGAIVSSGAWQHHELKIATSKVEYTKIQLPSGPVVPTPPLAAQQSAMKRGSKTGFVHRAKVKFAGLRSPGHDSPSSTPTPTIHVSPVAHPPASLVATPAIQEIKHLCGIMSTCGVQAQNVGALKDETWDLEQQYTVFLQPNDLLPGAGVPLTCLLQKSYRPVLSRRQRYALALTIASSHLQLQSTPWISRQWTAADVFFPLDGQVAILDRPYVSAEFGDSKPSPSSRAATSTDRAFTSLGIMLLELCSRKMLEDSDCWQTLQFSDAQKTQSTYRQIVAKKWADEIEEEEGPEMASAIMWCLNESPKALEGEQWRRDLAERVILLVQNCVHHLSRN